MTDPSDFDIELDTFLQRLRSEIEEFSNHWNHGRATKPDNYPLRMSEDDWYEQFFAYMN